MISAGAAFLMLPVITKTLGVYDYGLYSQFAVTITLLIPVIFLGLTMSMLRLLSSKDERAELREGFYSTLFFVTLMGLLLILVMTVISGELAKDVFSDPGLNSLILILPWIVLTSALAQLDMYFFRVVQKIKAYAFFSVAKSVGELAVILAFLLQGWGLEGVLLGMLLADLAVFLVSFAYILRTIGFSFPKFTMLKASLKFGLPVTPYTILGWVINMSFPYFIGFFLGLAYVGSYSAAYSIGGVLLLLANPIQLALLPILSRLYDATDIEGVKYHLSQSLRHYLILAIPAVAGLTALSPVLLSALTTPEFVSGATVLPFIAVTGVLGGVNMIISNILFLVKKTHLDLAVHIFSAAVVVVLNVLLIPTLGILGAALAGLLAYVVMTALTVYYSFRYLRFQLEVGSILKSVGSALAMSVAIFLLYPQDIVGLAVAIAVGGAVYFVAMVALKGLNVDEMNLLRGWARRALDLFNMGS